MPLTILDIIVILVVLISATLAMVRGFVREVLSVASWLAAVAAAYFFYKPLVPLIRPYIESNTVATIVAASVIFFVALIVASYITTKISDFVIDSRVGAIDRILGFVFGTARGVLLAVVAVWFFNFMVTKPPDWVAKAQSKPMLDDLGTRLVQVLPQDLEDWINSHAGANDTETTTGSDLAPPAENGTTTGDPAPNYDSPGLGRIIDSNSAGTGESAQ
jgi:membrane protein required for colicin V production